MNKKNILISGDKIAIQFLTSNDFGFKLVEIYKNKDLCFGIYEIKPVLYKM